MSTQLEHQTVREAIATMNRRFADAFASGNAEAIADLYTPDALLLPAASDFVSGHDSIVSFWRGAMAMGIAAVKLETMEIEALDGSAIEVGRYTLATAGGAVADQGKYLVVWHESDGGWRIHRDIWTTSQPPAAT